MCASSVLLSSPGSDSHLYDMPSCLASNLSLSLFWFIDAKCQFLFAPKRWTRKCLVINKHIDFVHVLWYFIKTIFVHKNEKGFKKWTVSIAKLNVTLVFDLLFSSLECPTMLLLNCFYCAVFMFKQKTVHHCLTSVKMWLWNK